MSQIAYLTNHLTSCVLLLISGAKSLKSLVTPTRIELVFQP